MYLLRGCVWRGEPSAACAVEPTPAAKGPALLPCREDVGRGSSVAVRAFNRPGMPAEDASCDVPACIGSHAARTGSVIDYMPRGADTTWAVPYAAYSYSKPFTSQYVNLLYRQGTGLQIIQPDHSFRQFATHQHDPVRPVVGVHGGPADALNASHVPAHVQALQKYVCCHALVDLWIGAGLKPQPPLVNLPSAGRLIAACWHQAELVCGLHV